MAEQATSKIDVAAEKAYADAAATTPVTPKTAVEPTKSAPALKTTTKAPAKPKPAAKKAPVKKVAAKKVAVKKTAAKPALKKTTAKKAAPKKTVMARKTAKAPAKAAVTKPITKSISKETIMTKAQETAADYTAQLKNGLADVQSKAKTAYEKSTVLASEMGEFSKANVEAVVESGKILATGMQDMAKSYVEEGKAAASTMTADAKEVAAVKSPTDFVQLQSKIASRNFDAAVATASKTTEAWVKLANEAFAPLSSRISVAMDKVRKAA